MHTGVFSPHHWCLNGLQRTLLCPYIVVCVVKDVCDAGWLLYFGVESVDLEHKQHPRTMATSRNDIFLCDNVLSL